MKTSLLVFSGPTGSGKSALATEAALFLRGEIVNADSIQLYRHVDIGAAKPSREEMSKVPHHLYSLFEPTDEVDVVRYVKAAAAAIAAITERGATPILCGGSGLYIRALLSGMVGTPELSEEAREHLRLGLETREPYAWLRELDAYTADALHPSDHVRVKRALLVFLSSGESLRRLQEAHQNADKNYRALVVTLLPPRDALYERLDRRIEQMLEDGFLEEATQLRTFVPSNARVWSSLGYRHAQEYFSGTSSYETMVENWKRDTRRYAKRQYTWWRHQPRALGWASVGSVHSEKVKSESSTEITEGLSGAIKNFLERRGAFKAEEIFFATFGNFSFGKNFCFL